MDGIITEDYGVSLRFAATEGMSSEQHSITGDSIADCRSSEQVENGTASTSLPYWDIDDDDDCGPKPLDLYGRFTWRIEKFSTINKKELRSNAFEVGGYKWYILIYPQGCEVCNHLSLFLCVANHEQLMPGWSHFAQFTIAVVNKDPKKSKYSDTLHRFWKKEHDWGWKKFMELSKIYDGFIFSDTLIIKAQVQVIREKTNRPFRCLDIQYRRELVRVYVSSAEQIFRRFLEERITKLRKFIEDILRWHSFCAFWLGIDANARRRMSRDKTDAILKVVVKHFFIEKEVTSTLVMDSLYSGLKSLEYQSKNMKGTAKLGESEELPAPMVHIDQDFFVLADDIIVLIERVVSDSLSQQPLPSKDDKYSQNRSKDGSAGDELVKESVERDERRLLELGRRTIEMFVLVQMFSRIEVSYQEVVALKRQEELIREEEVACQAQNEIKLKRGSSERERRSKKKQTKQKRNSRKGKDRGKDEDCYPMKETFLLECQSEDRILDSFSSEQVELSSQKILTPEIASDVHDAADDVVEVLRPDIDETSFCPSISDTDTSEVHPVIEINGIDVPNGQIDKRSPSLIADSLTLSTESVLSALDNVSYNGSTLPNNKKIQYSRSRRKNKRDIEKECIDSANGVDNQRAKHISDGSSHDINGKKASETEPDSTVSFMSEEPRPENNMAEKEDVAIPQKRSISKDLADADRILSSPSLMRKIPTILLQRKQSLATTASVTATASIKPSSNKKLSSNIAQADNATPITSRSTTTSSIHSEAQKNNISGKINSSLQANAMSRPSSAPLIPALRPTASITSTLQAIPLLSRSVSSAGRLGTAPSASAPSNVPQSYKNAIIGKLANASSSQSVACSQSPSEFASSASTLPQTPSSNEHMSTQSGLTFGCLNPEVVTNLHLHSDNHYEFTTSASSSSTYNSQSFSSLAGNIEKLNLYGNPSMQYPDAIGSTRVCLQPQDTVVEEFPHLDIINDLLDEDENIGRTNMSSSHISSQHYSLPVNYSNGETRLLVTSNRFGQSENHYGEGLQRGYDGASSNLLHRIRDEQFCQVDHSSYTNIMFDRSMQKQLPYRNTDPLMFNLTNGDANGYAHQHPYYVARGGNGFLYRPNVP